LAPGFLEKQLVKRFEKGKLEMKKERWAFDCHEKINTKPFWVPTPSIYVL
jgi:hypothetical protein